MAKKRKSHVEIHVSQNKNPNGVINMPVSLLKAGFNTVESFIYGDHTRLTSVSESDALMIETLISMHIEDIKRDHFRENGASVRTCRIAIQYAWDVARGVKSKPSVNEFHMKDGQRFHTVTRKDLYDACDRSSNGVALFQAPTGTGKSYMVCSDGGDAPSDDRVLLVPSYTLTSQLGRKYGVPFVNGDVVDFEIPSQGFGCIVSTYDGLNRVMGKVALSSTYLFVDESHQLTEAACYRMASIDFIVRNYHLFKGTVLMSATPKEGCPIEHDQQITVTRDEAEVPTYLTESTDYIAIGLDLLKRDDIETVVLHLNNKNKIAGIASILRGMGETVGVITSDNSDSDHVKALLSGELKTRWIIGTNSMNDGIDIFPRNFSLIISSESQLSSNSVQQAASRFRNSGVFVRPTRLVICRPSHDLTVTDPSEFPSLDDLLEEVTEYCEILSNMHKHLKRVGELDQPINRAINYQYNRMVHFEYDNEGNLTDIRPSASACMGEVDQRTTRMMTTGDLIRQIEEYGFVFNGFYTVETGEEGFEEDVKEAKKAVGRAQKAQVQKFIADFVDMASKAEDVAGSMLSERLNSATSRHFPKREVEAAKHIKAASKAILRVEGASYRHVAMTILDHDAVDGAALKMLAKKSQRHAVIYDMMNGQGRNRDDAAFLHALYDSYNEGDEFTGKEVDQLVRQLGGDSHKMLIPKNRVTLMKQLFTIKAKKVRRGDVRVRGYKVVKKGIIQKAVEEGMA